MSMQIIEDAPILAERPSIHKTDAVDFVIWTLNDGSLQHLQQGISPLSPPKDQLLLIRPPTTDQRLLYFDCATQ